MRSESRQRLHMGCGEPLRGSLDRRVRPAPGLLGAQGRLAWSGREPGADGGLAAAATARGWLRLLLKRSGRPGESWIPASGCAGGDRGCADGCGVPTYREAGGR